MQIASAVLLTFIKLRFIIKIFVLFIFEWPFYTGFTVHSALQWNDIGMAFCWQVYGGPLLCAYKDRPSIAIFSLYLVQLNNYE